MGMFDDLRCEYPLPADGANALSYQTKDTPNQCLDQFVICADGTLCEEIRKDGGKRLEPVADFLGELRFYTFEKDGLDPRDPGAWVEWSSYFVGGKLQQVHLISDTRAARAEVMAGLPPDTRTQKEKFDALFAAPPQPTQQETEG